MKVGDYVQLSSKGLKRRWNHYRIKNYVSALGEIKEIDGYEGGVYFVKWDGNIINVAHLRYELKYDTPKLKDII